MSENQVEAIEFIRGDDAAFGQLMDALSPDQAGEKATEGEQAAGAAGGSDTASAAKADGTGTPAVPVAGEGGAGSTDKPAAGAAGDTGTDAAAGDTGATGDAAPVGDRPDTWTASAADLQPRFSDLTTALETKTVEGFQATALEAVREEHAQYFAALEQHPYTMIGAEVPAIGREGTQVLGSTEEAREWQDAVKHLLVGEVRSRAEKALDESGDFLTTLHASIAIFQENADLIPGTKEFDTELANRFANLATPYELRVEGKLQGYSIPVQPIINNLREQLVKERAAKTAPAAADPPPAAGAPAAGAAAATGSPAVAPAAAGAPQAGIGAKAGNSSEKEDFSTLFGTIGLPNLQI